MLRTEERAKFIRTMNNLELQPGKVAGMFTAPFYNESKIHCIV